MGGTIGKLFFFKSGKDKMADVPASFFDTKVNDIYGKPVNFADFKGKYKGYIVVNVASACGLTDGNYRQLVKFHDQYHEKGLKILGFPCNQFKGQENSCDLDVAEFVKTKYGVKFDMFTKIEVNGLNCHPLYRFLRRNSSLFNPKTGEAQEIEWNFAKFILDAEGKVVAYKGPTDKPETFRPIIEELLSK